MGKRRSSKKVVSRAKVTLDRQFNCPHCSHEKSIDVRLDRPQKIGHLACRVCSVSWSTRITGLSEAVDVYSDWIDRNEELRQEGVLAAGQVEHDDAYGRGDDEDRDRDDDQGRGELRARADPYRRREHQSRLAAEEALQQEDEDEDELPENLFDE
ncbi:MAG: transcription elongation factor Elf1 like-domain-containing protein [Piptocephalis tieghemiana]|nr:MAG: transcription elongation factor Elf1 like-domain-containing protein [Piptocephalis tieghemiana]